MKQKVVYIRRYIDDIAQMDENIRIMIEAREDFARAKNDYMEVTQVRFDWEIEHRSRRCDRCLNTHVVKKIEDLKVWEEDICLDYKTGTTREELARKYATAEINIRAILDKNNVKMRDNKNWGAKGKKQFKKEKGDF